VNDADIIRGLLGIRDHFWDMRDQADDDTAPIWARDIIIIDTAVSIIGQQESPEPTKAIRAKD
jgi:hypothetical protein